MLEPDRQTLSELLQRNVLPQVILFYGREGVDTASLLNWLLQKLFCQYGEVCGKCADCQDIISGRHHEVFSCDAEAQKFGVENVNAIQEFLRVRSASAHGIKVVTIAAAHLVTVQAANKLLKTFEEPGVGIYIFLTSSSYLRILPTVTSRCFHFRLRQTSESPFADPYYEEVGELVSEDSYSKKLACIKKLKEKEFDLKRFLFLYEKHLNVTYRERLSVETQRSYILPRLRRARLHEIKKALFEHRSHLSMQLGVETVLLGGDGHAVQ